jgi:hypothetical protein
MTRQTRYFMAGSAAVLTVGLGIGLFAYYGGGFPALSASTGPTELAYVPADAAVIAYADVGAIMHSDFRRQMRHAMPGQERGQADFERETGIDIERDIHYVVAAVGPGEAHQALVVARGNFNPVQLETVAVQHGGTADTYRDRRLVSMAAGPDGKSATLAFLEPGLVAIGDSASVRRAIDARLNASSVTDNTDIMALVSQIERGHNAWAVGRFDALASQGRLPEQVTSQLPPVSWFAAAGQINGGVSGLVRVEASDDEAAELLRRQVNGALAFGEMMSRSDARAAAALRSLNVTGTGRTVQLSFQLPAELFQMMVPQFDAGAGVGVEPQH